MNLTTRPSFLILKVHIMDGINAPVFNRLTAVSTQRVKLFKDCTCDISSPIKYILMNPCSECKEINCKGLFCCL